MFTYLTAFGLPVYHGKELCMLPAAHAVPALSPLPSCMLLTGACPLRVVHSWKGVDVDDKPAHVEAIIASRMLRDWDSTRDLLAAQFAPQFLSNASQKAYHRGWRRLHGVRGGGPVPVQARAVRRRNAAANYYAPQPPRAGRGRGQSRGRGHNRGWPIT
jgi:hypothetical protein